MFIYLIENKYLVKPINVIIILFLIDVSDSLVKICEEVDPERVLLIEFVAISILHSFKGLSGSSIFQEYVPAKCTRCLK